jgi:hypothetical protein
MASSAPSGEAVASPTLESIPAPVQDMAALNVKDPVTEAVTEAVVPETEAAEVPPHRSHDPTNNLKRSDPFQFGSRYLSEGDNVFEFNAWDHVETDDAYKEYAEQQFAKQRQHPVSDFEKSKSPPQFSHQIALPPGVLMIQHQCIVHLNLLKTNYSFLFFRSHLIHTIFTHFSSFANSNA